MDYGKIKPNGQIQKQGNPVSVTIANPNEEQKKTMAGLRGELELVYTEQPTYDPETEYLREYWQEEEGKAVQHWEVIPIEPEEE